ncbi:hypothetical protein RI054_16g77210 [Pseudoscourfieldia marina]
MRPCRSARSQRGTKYRELAQQLIIRSEDDALGEPEAGVDGAPAKRVARALMGLHRYLQMPEAPPVIVQQMPAPGNAAAAQPAPERSTSSDTKTMTDNEVRKFTDAGKERYNQTWGPGSLPPRRFMASMLKNTITLSTNANGIQFIDWQAYPSSDDAVKLTRAKSTMASTMSVLAPTSALKLLRSQDDGVEFEESDGTILDTENATIEGGIT